MTAEEVDVFTGQTKAHNLLYQHHRWLFVLQTNGKEKKKTKENIDTEGVTGSTAFMLDSNCHVCPSENVFNWLHN